MLISLYIEREEQKQQLELSLETLQQQSQQLQQTSNNQIELLKDELERNKKRAKELEQGVQDNSSNTNEEKKQLKVYPILLKSFDR